MNNPLLPIAVVGLMVAIAVPAQAAIDPDSTHPDQTDIPITEDRTEATTSADPTSGALNFNPPQPGSEAIAAVPPSGQAQGAAPTLSDGQAPGTAPTSTSSSPHPPIPPSPTSAANPGGDALFAGGSESVMARVVGAAEGTRAPNGDPTSLYEGHTDPGNGVWNRGTFSYQFGNEENLSPEEADKRQMAKIKHIHDSVMMPKAEQRGVAPLTLLEELNGIDLINQAPLAVTEEGGYVERLAEAKRKKGLSGEEAILDARVWAFWDSDRGGWDAPGLRAYDDLGKETSIRHDQERRMGMIDEALESYEQQHGAVAKVLPKPRPEPQKMAASPPLEASRQTEVSQTGISQKADPNDVADLIIFQTPVTGQSSDQILSTSR